MEPTERELKKIQEQLDKGEFYDEEFDDFSIMEGDFNIDEDYLEE